jgi:hypothetical protein
MDTNEKVHCDGCKNPGCQCDNVWAGRCGHHRITHLIIKVLAIGLIFWCGVQLGEVSGRFHHRHHGYQMMQSYGGNNFEYRVMPMGSKVQVSTSTATTTLKK